MKNYKQKKSAAISLFRLGYDELKTSIHSLKQLIKMILQLIPPIPKHFNHLINSSYESV